MNKNNKDYYEDKASLDSSKTEVSSNSKVLHEYDSVIKTDDVFDFGYSPSTKSSEDKYMKNDNVFSFGELQHDIRESHDSPPTDDVVHKSTPLVKDVKIDIDNISTKPKSELDDISKKTKKTKKPTAKKPAAKKATAKKATAKKATAKKPTAKKATAKKATAKKPAAKKPTAKKPAAKKPAAKKPAAKKPAAKKPAAKKATAKKATAKKATAKKATAKKPTAKKAATKRPAAKKNTMKSTSDANQIESSEQINALLPKAELHKKIIEDKVLDFENDQDHFDESKAVTYLEEESPISFDEKNKSNVINLVEINDVTKDQSTKKPRNTSTIDSMETITINLPIEQIIDTPKPKGFLMIRSLVISEEGYTIVKNIDLDIRRGQIHSIIANEHKTETILLKSFINIFGKVRYFKNKSIECNFVAVDFKHGEVAKNKKINISYIPENPQEGLLPNKSIFNIFDTLLKKHRKDLVSKYQRKIYAIQLLESQGIKYASKRIDFLPFNFSNSELQIINILMSVSTNSELLLLNNIYSHVDVETKFRIDKMLLDVKRKYNMTIIMVDNNKRLLLNKSDYVYVMFNGKVVEKGSSKEIMTNPTHPFTWNVIENIIESKELLSEKITFDPIQSNSSTDTYFFGDPFVSHNIKPLFIDYIMSPKLFFVDDSETSSHFAATWLLHPNAEKILPSDKVQTFSEMMKERLNKNEKK